MLFDLIKTKKDNWFKSDECTVRNIVKHIQKKSELRDTQIEAIETYLFLKIKCDNKPLWELFSDGFFISDISLSELNINEKFRDFLSNNIPAFALFDFAKGIYQGKKRLPELEKTIMNDYNKLDYISIIRNLFYNVDYADYLMSLPMGAGKTYLMAAIIYIDLYFSLNEPNNTVFSHNFLILIPSGLKSSIVPSLKDMALLHF